MKKQENLKIVGKQIFHRNYVLFELQCPQQLEFIQPGQFINILVANNPKVFLRRPFSIHYVDYEKNTISFILKVVGEGTKTIAASEIGDFLNVIFPLGNGFSLPDHSRALLIGGGYGVAPLYHLAAELKKKNSSVTFLFGARTVDDIILTEKFEQLGNLFITTEDGSMGYKGLVTQHPLLDEIHGKVDFIFTCGPEAMMFAVAEKSKQLDINCELSLDYVMGCGIGVCLSCVAKTVRGNETSCIYGPVYNSKDLIW